MQYSLLIFVISCAFSGLGCVEGVINGTNATVGEFPHMMMVMKNRQFTCGGALISDKHVLSAAHCFVNSANTSIQPIPANYSVKVGVINRTEVLAGIDFEVDKIGVHPQFGCDRFHTIHDIAVLTLNKSVPLSETVKPIALPEPMEEFLPFTRLTFSGFGRVSASTNVSLPEYLQKMTPRVISYFECIFSYGWGVIVPGQLCTEVGTCSGDSGGPLTIDGQFIVGINSMSWCASRFIPDVYTKVSHYIDFIKDEMYPMNKSRIEKTPVDDSLIQFDFVLL